MEFLGVTLTGWTAIIITLSMGVLAGMMFILGTKKMHYAWGYFSLATTIWAAAFYGVTLASTPEVAQLWWKFSFIGIILVPFTFFHFVLEFIDRPEKPIHFKKYILVLMYFAAGVFLILNLSTNLIIDQVTFLFNELYYNVPPGRLHPYFMGLYGALVLYSYFLAFQAYRSRPNDVTFRKQVIYFFIGTAIGLAGASMDFLLVYGIEIHPIRNLSVVFGSFLVGFAILRYRLFDVKVVAAQFLTFILIAFAFIRIVVSNSFEETLFNILLLIVTFTVGVYLILSVRKEVQQREEIERLAGNLQVANTRLKEMDQLKSQFLSIASHDLRAPLTAIRNFMSILLEGTYGKLPAAAEEGTRQVYERATEMAEMVDNYLNVSRIEQGRMKYDFTDIDFKDTLNEAVDAFAPVAEEKGLTFNFTDLTEPLPMKADEPKLREVVENLINNAINYTPQGSITVTAEKTAGKVTIRIEDTGIGMSEKTIKNLFGLFAPGEDSRKYNPKSTGVGLYITKAHVTAHKGTVRAESDGEGKGSRFSVELPLKIQ